MKKWLLVAMLVLCAGAANAAEQCYHQEEFDADRGLRMHSDTEVILLTCRYSTKGEDLKKSYAAFLQKNSAIIHTWELVIAKKFSGTGRSRNEVIDNFRTKLANQKANEVGRMGPKPFCKEWADYLPWVSKLNAAEILQYVRASDDKRPTRLPLCN